mgnify:FL=1
MSKPKDQRYVHKPIEKFGFVVDVGYYNPNGEWVPAPRIKGFMNSGGPLSGPRWGYDNVTGIRYVVWLTGNNGEEPEFLDGWDSHGH